MKNKTGCPEMGNEKNVLQEAIEKAKRFQKPITDNHDSLPEILFITSYPPRVCGIATYSQDLIHALNNKFCDSLSMKVCALESGSINFLYPPEVKYVLKTSVADEYSKLAKVISNDYQIKIIVIQHEFGFFKGQDEPFLQFLYELSKPVIIVFHTVLPHPEHHLKLKVKNLAAVCESIVVMTHQSSEILRNDYGILKEKISVIAHGTHLVPHLSETFLKKKYGLINRKVLCTFGLLSSGKSIETTIEALPAIIKQCAEVVFLIIGKTHPEVIKAEGENYRLKLEQKVALYGIQDHVIFINNYLALSELLEYLQLTDVYLFTTNDPFQAVSGTFAYAMSCACPIISTPIPHAKELLTSDTGIIFDFQNSQQLADAAILLLNNESLRKNMSVNTLQKIAATAWENSAVAHAVLFEKIGDGKISIQYNIPPMNLNHLIRMTTKRGLIQFSKINQPDIDSGYTLDDNARALVTVCMYFKLKGDEKSLFYIEKYLNFIKFCLQPKGNFLNYVDKENRFTDQNNSVNLDDSNGRAIWALGYLVSLKGLLPDEMILKAENILDQAWPWIKNVHSTRAMAFAIKGIYYNYSITQSRELLDLLKTFADRLLQMYKHESGETWKWFEGYLTYANSILPEAMLYTWLVTGETIYKDIATSSFDFLLSQTFNENGIEVISNKKWLHKGHKAGQFGEQPIDVANTVITLSNFYDAFQNQEYRKKIQTAFNWFLGYNRLHQIVYNPCTGGCHDGLEESHVNLNQGAESTVSYLMARLTVESYVKTDRSLQIQGLVNFEKKTKRKEDMIQSVLKNSKALSSYYFITNGLGITIKEPKKRNI